MKCDAFGMALNDYPRDVVATFIRYHKSNGGYSRFEKFRYFLRRFIDNVESSVDSALTRFASAVSESYAAMPPIPRPSRQFRPFIYVELNFGFVQGRKKLNYKKSFVITTWPSISKRSLAL